MVGHIKTESPLNSDQCRELLKRRNFSVEVILKMMDREKLFRIQKAWLDINDKRENEMIKNIYSHIELGK